MDGTDFPSADARVLIMFIALFLLILYFFARASRPLPSIVSLGTIALLVMLGTNVLLAGAVVWNIRPNWSLLQLDANRVASIAVDSTTIDDPAKVAKIVGALHESRMFDPKKRHWGKPVRLQIVLTSGETREYRLARDFDSPAVFIEFLPKYGIGWGYAFSSRLVLALDEARVTLPD
jgi:hypothetical protein